MWKYIYFRGLKYNRKLKMQKNIVTKLHVKFHEKKNELKKNFHENPVATSRQTWNFFAPQTT